MKYEDILVSKSKIEKAVRVIRLKPGQQNQVGVGLENGEIHLWDLLSGKTVQNTSKYLQFKDEKNRVFDLRFTNDSQTLIAAYGGGQIRQWNLSQPGLMDFKIPLREIKSTFTISTLGISENNDLSLVIVGGRYNKLAFWDWKKSQSESEKGENKNENESQSPKLYRLSYKSSNRY